MKTLLFFIFFVCLTPNSSRAVPSGDEIRKKSSDVYSSVDFYQDHGVQTNQNTDSDSGRVTRSLKKFQTSYDRKAQRLKFEYTEPAFGGVDWDRSVLVANGLKAKTWWTLEPKKIQEESLKSSVARFTGVSGNTIRLVSRLIPEVDYGSKSSGFCPGENVQVVEDMLDGGLKTFMLEAKSNDGTLSQYWFDQQAFLLRKVFEKQTFSRDGGSWVSETTTQYFPTIGKPIADSEFAFDIDTKPNS